VLCVNFSPFFFSSFADARTLQHTVNEKAGIDAHLQITKFVHALMQAANDYDGPESA
jgi:hypothetical protein